MFWKKSTNFDWVGLYRPVSNSSTLHLSWIIINQKNNMSWTKMSHVSYHNKWDDLSYMFSTLQFKNNYFLKLIERVIVWNYYIMWIKYGWKSTTFINILVNRMENKCITIFHWILWHTTLGKIYFHFPNKHTCKENEIGHWDLECP